MDGRGIGRVWRSKGEGGEGGRRGKSRDGGGSVKEEAGEQRKQKWRWGGQGRTGARGKARD